MKNHFKRGISALAFALSALSVAPIAQAAIVAYDFNVVVDAGGPLANQPFAGSFSYNDQLGATANGETSYALDEFSFSFNGSTYTKASAGFNASAVSIQNGAFLGMSGGLAGLFEFVQGVTDTTDAFFAFALNGVEGLGGVTFTLQEPGNDVPEPATGALLVAAFAAIAVARKAALRK